MILTNKEILSMDYRATTDEAIRFARIIETAVIKKLQEQRTPIQIAPEGYRFVSTEKLNEFQELNMSNYNHDDVHMLNTWAVELVLSSGETIEFKKSGVAETFNMHWAKYRDGQRTMLSTVVSYIKDTGYEGLANRVHERFTG